MFKLRNITIKNMQIDYDNDISLLLFDTKLLAFE